MSVIGADRGGGEGEKVIVKHSLSEKLVKESGGVDGAQGTSEPGVLDGNIHCGWRRFGLCLLGLAQVGRSTCRTQSPVGQKLQTEQE